MVLKRLFILIVFGYVWATVSTKKLPAHFPRCHKVKNESDIPIFEECFKGVGLKWREFLKKGVPELRIPPLEPFIIPQITVEQNGTISYILKMYNTSFAGLTDYTVDHFKYSIQPQKTINGTLAYRALRLDGTYDLKGDFFGLKFNGNGPWHANLSDVTLQVTTIEELYTKKGKQYLNLTNLETETRIGKATANLENFFGSNDILNSALNDFLNEFSVEIIETIKPDIKAIMRQVVKAIKKQVTSKVPYDDMFLPD